jgi:hypothetical protein
MTLPSIPESAVLTAYITVAVPGDYPFKPEIPDDGAHEHQHEDDR